MTDEGDDNYFHGESAKGKLKSHRYTSGVYQGRTEESPLHGVPRESAKGELKSHRYTKSLRSLPREN
ncbi:hypothetical protein EYF80_034679 [Liparis tanakae]|uniref:Uncharacterized protein n=1 Tax=Liparis tanakae TaxID=230148 RepID=A0A4Z2GPR3_9TELE|nr:hypothetical protein EYF80_034679 [Liparis tanakae]